MCGRYASSRSPDDLIAEFEIEQLAVDETLEPDYNVAPTKNVYAVLQRPPRGSADQGADDGGRPVRQLRVVSWGLVPSWAASPGVGGRFINARMETITAKPAYRRAFAVRRCLLPADGYFEWSGEGSGPERKRGAKQPYFIRPRDGGVLAMAGLYELWRDPTRAADDPRRWRWTAAVVTTAAEPGIARLHDRMPLLLPPERYGTWLDPRPRSPDELRRLLEPAAPGRLEAFPVSTAVNNVANGGPQLVEPLPPATEAAEVVLADGRLF
jgi:putative SOS response-associated peptidase YedK